MKMSRIRTLGILAGLLAAADWFVVSAPAGDGEDAKNQLTIDKAVVTAALRDVEKDGKKEKHLFLDVKGDGKGTVKVSLQETKIQPMSRMMPRPQTKWEREISIDTSKATSIDLGAAPADEKNVSRALVGSVDGKPARRLLVMSGKAIEGLDD